MSGDMLLGLIHICCHHDNTLRHVQWQVKGEWHAQSLFVMSFHHSTPLCSSKPAESLVVLFVEPRSGFLLICPVPNTEADSAITQGLNNSLKA